MFPMRARQNYDPGSVLQPTDVDLQLVRVRTGQQHAVVQRMQEPLLGNPAAAAHQFLLHVEIWPAGPPTLMKPIFTRKRTCVMALSTRCATAL